MDDFYSVYIVGNGLDICCGLKSSYEDFMQSLKYRIKELPCLVQYLYKTHEKKMWTDLESELGEIAKGRLHPIADENIYRLISDADRFKREFFELQSLLSEYLNNVPRTNNGNDFPLSLMDKYSKGFSKLYVLNFNYTPTIENYLERKFQDVSRYKINHIHGTLLDGNIIIGVQDSVELNKNQSFLYKTRRVNTKNVYEIGRYLDSAIDIIVFGYSLGESDYSYFEHLFHEQCKDTVPGKRFIFYHYGEKGRDDIDYNLRVLTGNQLNLFYRKNEVDFIDTQKI